MSNEELKTLKNKRRAVKAAVTRFESFLDSINSDISTDQIRDRREIFVDTYNSFNEIQSQIEDLDETEYDSDERETFENRFFVLKDKSYQLIKHVVLDNNADNHTEQRGSSITSSSSNMWVKLPTISLPNFSGSYEDWLSFYDTFNSLIHANDAISEIQKFHYLKSCLKGEAANVLHSLEISSNNYSIAWKMLEERYNNKRLIVQKHINAIFNLPISSKENHSTLRQLVDGVSKHIRALAALKRPTHEWDDLLIHILISKLDTITVKEWEASLTNDDLPTFDQIIKFLIRKCQTLETVSKPVKNYTQGFKTSSVHVVTNKAFSCLFCDEQHMIYKCKKLLELSVDQRIHELKIRKICINCLKSKHSVLQCTAGNCRKCGERHNSILHKSRERVNVLQPDPPPEVDTSISNHTFNFKATTHALLSTALVNILDSIGNKHVCRILLDSGSQSNLITRALADKLMLEKKPTQISIAGINQSTIKAFHLVETCIESRCTNFKTNLNCIVLDKISERIPLISFSREYINIPKNIKLADPEFNISNQIDMLIGVELFYKLLCIGQINFGQNQPCLQKTLLGWLVSGNTTVNSNLHSASICNLSTAERLNQNLVKFWELENVNHAHAYSLEEMQCETHFMHTTERNSDGRFVVALPFKNNALSLGNSREHALKRFYSLERKLNQNTQLKIDYSNFIKEYIELGHMKLIQNPCSDESNTSHFYLPHHAVIKESSITTKIRVVFDASAKSSTGVSLNDTLMVGPKLQQDLFDIVCRFRIHKHVLTADITKMYRQVGIREDCMSYQRILWRENEAEPVKTFELATVTYGTASASYLAIKSLQQLANEEFDNFKLGAEVILRDFYVDDLITGADNADEVLKIKNEVVNILAKGKFELRKWASNTPELLHDLANESDDNIILKLDKSDGINTLGLQWNAKMDTLQYSFHAPCPKKCTKRSILSHISKIFDPLGLLTPFTVRAKILMQQMWLLNLNWDESIPLDLQNIWLSYMDEMKTLKSVKISRCVISVQNPTVVELHGFCDASEKAYGVCIYIRALNALDDISCKLLCSKSKVAPLKATTLPRLELCGALLLAQVVHRLKQTLSININQVYYWTDSSIVLSWLKSTSKTWKTFVANRVSEIHELSNCENWHHISTELNPADIVSRGASLSPLTENKLWWNGPQFLESPRSYWPQSTITEIVENMPELRTAINIVNVGHNKLDLFTRYSSLSKLQRIVAYCLRFKDNVRSRINKNCSHIRINSLTSNELSTAMTALVKACQVETFSREHHQLVAKGMINSKSNISCLNPFVDEQGLIRVGGRLKHSNINYSQKHQVLLPSKHPLTKLIVRHEHVKQLHAGVQLTIASIRSKYWPLAIKNTVKFILRDCITCFRSKPEPVKYLMGNLPLRRVKPARPFEHVGVDYFGPIYIREGRKRKPNLIKTYGSVFVCFSTKALHIELVSDLTADSFIAALKRFTSRRGKPSTIYSDNGTQFVGANKELGILMRQFKSQISQIKIREYLAVEGTEWHFIPPRAPHFGGLWEAAVKSFKTHLVRVVGKTSLNYEEMYTLLVQIEGILNSRPITPISEDPNDFSFLTPSHFLTGDIITAIPEPNLEHLKCNTLSRWQYIQQLRDHFWKRWQKEYLNELQVRTKWQRSGSSLLVPGTLAVLREDNVPPSNWITGRIIQIFPGDDGVVRTAKLQTIRGVIQRPANKLCVLPIDNSD